MNYTKVLSEDEWRKADLILRFLEIAQRGIVKPYDPIKVIEKLPNEILYKNESGGLNKTLYEEVVTKFNPGSSTVHDAIEFRPYILAALEDFAGIMGHDTKKNQRSRHYE